MHRSDHVFFVLVILVPKLHLGKGLRAKLHFARRRCLRAGAHADTPAAGNAIALPRHSQVQLGNEATRQRGNEATRQNAGLHHRLSLRLNNAVASLLTVFGSHTCSDDCDGGGFYHGGRPGTRYR